MSRAVECIRHAQDDADADMPDVLRSCWSAYEAVRAAVGSWTQSMLLDGRSWAEIANALDVLSTSTSHSRDPGSSSG